MIWLELESTIDDLPTVLLEPVIEPIAGPDILVRIRYKSIAGRYRSVRVADGPITACFRYIKNASWDECHL